MRRNRSTARPGEPERFEQTKVVVSRMADRLSATVDYDHLYVKDALLVHPRSHYCHEFLCAVLNSQLLDRYYSSTFTTLDLHRNELLRLPIRHIEFMTPADEREQLVKEAKGKTEETIGALVASGVVRSGSPLDRAVLMRAASPALQFVEERLEADPEQSDVIHDLLAYLAEQMVTMNKAKQTMAEAFWLDLEGITGADSFEVIRNKGKQERTLWKQGPACRPFVREDSHAACHLDESLGWSEEAFKVFVKALVDRVPNLSDLVNVYRAHSPAYGELVARIEATDWLIDQIVYKLYGLRREEIAIVEGRGE